MSSAEIPDIEGALRVTISPKFPHPKDHIPSKCTNIVFKLTYNLFKFGYKLGVSPYGFQYQDSGKSSGGQNVVLETSTFHKITAILTWLISLLHYYISQRKRVIVGSLHSSVLTYFNLSHGLMHASTISVFYIQLFREKASFQKLISIMSDSELLTDSKWKLNEKLVNWIIFAIHFFFLIGTPLLIILEPLGTHEWEVTETMKWHITRGTSYIFCSQHTQIANDTRTTFAELSNISVSDCIYGMVYVLTFLIYFVMSQFRCVSFIHPGMILYVAVKSFTTSTMNSSPVTGTCKLKLLEKYNQLKILTKTINETCGATLFFVLLDHVMWLATDLNSGIQERSPILRITNVWYFLSVSILCAFAAEACRKMREFKSWLVETGPSIFQDQQEYSNFLTSVEVNEISIGLPGLYKLDYGFVGQVVSLVITLFIITLQSERPST